MKNLKPAFSFLWIFMAALYGCNSALDVQEYIRWNNKSPVQQTIALGNIEISCIYKPSDLMALNDMREGIYSMERDSTQKILKQYEASTYVVLQFDTKDKKTPILKYQLTSEQEYNDRIFYFNTGVAKDITAINGNDTLRIANYIFERAYSLRSFENVLIAFDSPLDKDKPLIIKYRGLFTKSPLVFEFNPKTLKSIPELKI